MAGSVCWHNISEQELSVISPIRLLETAAMWNVLCKGAGIKARSAPGYLHLEPQGWWSVDCVGVRRVAFVFVPRV